jgi:ubiquinone/menaquinone biosynthesis C-methylase UbiE
VSEKTFDYESKVWGATEVRLSPTYIQALKLRYCLMDLAEVRGRVLDVGCGGGNIPRAIKHYRPDLEVWGVDHSQKAVRAAHVSPNGTRYVAASGEDLPFHDGFFDAVTMFDVLEHLPDPEKSLRDVRRVLRRGGVFHLFLPLEKQPCTIYSLLHRWGWKAKLVHCGHIRYYTDQDGRELLETAGFKVQNLRWSFHPIFAAVDVAYFTLLTLSGKKVTTSVEGYVGSGKPTLAKRFVGALKSVLVSIGYLESRLLWRLPGGGGHFSALRNNGYEQSAKEQDG